MIFLLACSDQKLGTFNGEPSAEILSHVDGDSVIEASVVAFRGSVSDPDDAADSLVATWYVDGLEACSGAPESDGTTACDIPVTIDTLEILLEVIDPSDAGASDKVTLVVVPLATPGVTIDSPEIGARGYSDAPMSLLATATDGDDLLDTLTYSWTSSIDGALVSGGHPDPFGATEDVVFLAAGNHTLTITVVDDDGNQADASVGVVVAPNNTLPSCGITAPADGTVAALGSEIVFTGTVGDVDQPADGLVVSWTSDIDGSLGSDPPDTSGGVTLRTSALAAGTHLVTLTATDERDAACTDAILVTVGSPPTVTIEVPSDGTTVAEGEAVTFSGTVVDAEDGLDEPAVEWSTDIHGRMTAGFPDASGVTAFTEYALDAGVHIVTLTATDSDGLAASARITLTVNALPSAPIVSISPDPATSSDALLASVDTDSVDPEGASVSYRYEWLLDGVVSTASTSATVSASDTTRGDRWRVRVYGSDGRAEGPAGEAEVTIDNSAPSIASVAITPNPAASTDTLTCTPSGFADADGDGDLSTFAWTVGGVTVGTGTSLSSGFSRGDNVTCTVTPFDGYETGTPVSAVVTIDNAPPSVSAVSITPTTAYTNDTLTASATSSDADGDSVSVAFAWYVNGTLAGTSTTLNGTAAFDKDDVVYVTATPSDGTDTGSSRSSASVTILNSVPGAPTVTIDPADPVENEDVLRCSIVTASTDADGDAITYAFTWQVDGLDYGTEFDTGDGWAGAYETDWPYDTVPALDTAAAERWTCTATPDDGDGEGASGSASVVIGAGSTSVDYSDTWTLDDRVNYTCAFGLVNFSFTTLTVSDAYPTIVVRASGNMGTMTGSFSTATDFDAENYLAGTCAETYTITGSFTDANTMDALIEADYVGSCYGCVYQSWNVTATR